MKTDKKIKAYKLNNEELKAISGGSDTQYMKMACPHCGKVNMVNVMSDLYKCDYCKSSNTIAG